MNKGILALVIGALAVGGVVAQEEQTPEQRLEQMVERTVERLQRSLDLSDSQVEQVESILKETIGERNGLDAKERERIEAILTPDQKERYAQARDRGRGGRDRGGRGGFGGGGMMSGWMDRMKTDLNLTEEQVGKVEEMLSGAQEQMAERFRAMREGGFQGQDWGAIREEMGKFWEETQGQIEGLLDETQKAKFAEMVEEMRNQNPMLRQGGRRGGPDGAPTPPGGDRGGRGFGGERRVDRAMEAHGLTEEEASIVRPMVEAIEQARAARAAVEEARRALLESIEAGADEENLGARLGGLREAQKAQQAALQAKREELRELMTLEQEAKLVAQGILD